MSYIVLYFRNIVIFIIFSTFVSLLLPSNKYKQFIDLVMGLILVSIILSPITKLLNINAEDFNFEIPYSDSNIVNEDLEKNYTIELYQNQIANQIATLIYNNYLVDTDVVVTVDAVDLSKVTNVNVTMKNSAINIEPIVIGEQSTDETDSQIETDIKNLISNAYNLSVSNIYIKMAN